MVAFEVYRDKVVIKNADGTTTGRLVAAFEFIYFPKEQGCARATRVNKTQKEINDGFTSASLLSPTNMFLVMHRDVGGNL